MVPTRVYGASPRRGYDVFTLDYQNYGRSDHHDCGLCVNTLAAARNIESAVDFILQFRGVSKLHLIGWSSGGATGGPSPSPILTT